MIIKPNLHTWIIKQSGKKDHYTYDTLKVERSSGKRLYLTAIKDGIRMVEVVKTMKFEQGKIYLSFGKVKHEIGTYEEVAA